MPESLKEYIDANLPGWTLDFESKPVCLLGKISLIQEGNVVDVFDVKIELAENHPLNPPRLFEIGGRIERVPDRHINGDGSACLYILDETRRYWNETTQLADFIAGAVTSYFISQSYFELTGQWIFGERRHEFLGVMDFYLETLGITDKYLLEEMMAFLSKDVIKGHWPCPCRSGNKLRNCHGPTIYRMRQDISLVRLKEVSKILTTT